MKIGDILPLPADYDPELVKIAMNRRRLTEQTMNSSGGNQVIAASRKAIKASMANQARLRDPLEQAKHYLRRAGFVPVCTLGGKHMVGSHRFNTDSDLFVFATEKGWGR